MWIEVQTTEPVSLKGDETRRSNKKTEDNCWQQYRQWVEWADKQAVATLHSVLMGFYQDHEFTYYKCKLTAAEGAFFLARLGVIAFSCKYSCLLRD